MCKVGGGGGEGRGGEGKCRKLLRREKKSQWGVGGGARLIYTQLTVCSTGHPPILCIWKLRSIARAPSSKLFAALSELFKISLM